MQIEYGPVWSKVISITQEELAPFQTALTCPEGYCLVRSDWSFLSGNLYRLKLQGLIIEGGPELQIPPEVPEDILSGIVLRDYQIETAKTFFEHRRGIAALATGSGKTEVLSCILRLIPGRSITIVDTIASARQLVQRLKKRGVENVGLLGSGVKKIGQHTVVISDTAHLLLQSKKVEFKELIQSVDLLAFDEAHHLGTARTWQEIGLACPAPLRIGLTATPFGDTPTMGDMLLEGILGPVFSAIKSKTLRDAGVLAEPYVFILPVAGKRVAASIHDWNVIEKQAIMEHAYRNDMIAQLCSVLPKYSPDCRVLLLVRRINHGIALMEKIAANGVKVVFSSGSNTARFPGGQEHKIPYGRVCERFEDGDWNILIGSVVYDESQDIPSITDLVLGSAGRKIRRILQRLGRGERRTTTKDYVRVWDFWDSQHWATANQSRQRRKVFQEEQIRVIEGPQLIQQMLSGACSPEDVVRTVRSMNYENNQSAGWGSPQIQLARSL